MREDIKAKIISAAEEVVASVNEATIANPDTLWRLRRAFGSLCALVTFHICSIHKDKKTSPEENPCSEPCPVKTSCHTNEEGLFHRYVYDMAYIVSGVVHRMYDVTLKFSGPLILQEEEEEVFNTLLTNAKPLGESELIKFKNSIENIEL